MNKKTIILENLSKEHRISILSLDQDFVFSEVDLNVTVYFGRSLSLGYRFKTLNSWFSRIDGFPNKMYLKSKGRTALVIIESKCDVDLSKIKVQTECMSLA